MGYDLERFKNEVNKEFICAICTCVLEDPVIALECDHTFCRACIADWLNVKQQCPIDNSVLKLEDLRAVSRIVRNLLAEHVISCDYASSGCSMFIKLGDLDAHVKDCEFNPTVLVPCKNCGMNVLRATGDEHNCVKELGEGLNALKLENQEIKEKLTKLTEENTKLVEEHARSIVELKQELTQLKHTSEDNTKTILDKIKNLNDELRIQTEDNVLRGEWWKQLQLLNTKFSALSYIPPENILDYFLKEKKIPLESLQKLVLCECFGEDYHQCGAEKLAAYPLYVRRSSVSRKENYAFYFYLILKSENTHIPKHYIPKCGYIILEREQD